MTYVIGNEVRSDIRRPKSSGHNISHLTPNIKFPTLFARKNEKRLALAWKIDTNNLAFSKAQSRRLEEIVHRSVAASDQSTSKAENLQSGQDSMKNARRRCWPDTHRSLHSDSGVESPVSQPSSSNSRSCIPPSLSTSTPDAAISGSFVYTGKSTHS